jgi:putative membrane protein
MTWHLHVDAISMVIILVGLYALRAQWAADKVTPRPRPTHAHLALYGSGVFVLYLGAGSPIHDISEQYLFSVHMVQHMLFTLVAPPLLLLGLPDWMLRPLIQPRLLRTIAYQLTRPLPAFALFNIAILVTHLPPVTDLALRVHAFHFFVHVVLVATALVMWWPVFSPLPELPRLGPFAQLIYLFIQQLLPAVLASFFTLGGHVIYPFYANVPERLWGISAMDDQIIAGLVMKLAGGALMWGIMTTIFFRWFADEDRHTARAASAVTPAVAPPPTPVQCDEVEEELERMGLTRR